MNYLEFLNRVIDEGIEAAKLDYSRPRHKQNLEGSLAGFELCRDMGPQQLAVLLREAGLDRRAAGLRMDSDYWFWRCREAEIEWVCNVVSAMLVNEGKLPIVPVTARGALKAAEVLGCTS